MDIDHEHKPVSCLLTCQASGEMKVVYCNAHSAFHCESCECPAEHITFTPELLELLKRCTRNNIEATLKRKEDERQSLMRDQNQISQGLIELLRVIPATI